MFEIAKSAIFRGVEAVKPEKLVAEFLAVDPSGSVKCGEELTVDEASIKKVLVVGAGKAGAGMSQGVIDALGDRWAIKGLVNVPGSEKDVISYLTRGDLISIELNPSGHPEPDEAGWEGGKDMVKLLEEEANSDTLVIVLLSGGGSALLPSPIEPITLDALKTTTKLLLNSGARIDDVNTIRKHIESLKGGQLARLISMKGAKCITLIISDVVGDDLSAIASGPTVPDDSTYFQAICICQRLEIDARIPSKVWWHLTRGLKSKFPETPKSEDRFAFNDVHSFLIGSAATAVDEISRFLESKGFEYVKCFTRALGGEARDFGFDLPHCLEELMKEIPENAKKVAFVGSGELTVTIKGDGKGGRNQEMLLSFLIALRERKEEWLKGWKWGIISAAFDGIEGNSGAMGAYIGSEILEKIEIGTAELKEELEKNNSNAVWEKFGTVLKPGYTGTNVNDTSFAEQNCIVSLRMTFVHRLRRIGFKEAGGLYERLEDVIDRH